MPPHPRQLYVISGPSGVGKTSLTRALVAGRPDLALSVSYTTRPARRGETDGVNYHFVDAATFSAMAARGAFLEHAQVFGHAYGTARETVEAALAAGRGVVLEIDWQGAAQVRRAWPAAVLVMIVPPSVRSLGERLAARGDGDAAVERRMRTALAEIGHWREFDYLVVNHRFEDALADLAAVVHAGTLSRAASEPWLRSALPELFEGPPGSAC